MCTNFSQKKRLLRKNRRRKKVKKTTTMKPDTNIVEDTEKPPRKLHKVKDLSNVKSYDDISSTTSSPSSSVSRSMSPVIRNEISSRLPSGIIIYPGK